MRIGELAQQAGVTTTALRFYEQAGVLPEPARSPSGYRDYDPTALARLRFIKGAQAAGLTLAEICRIVAVREAQGPPCAHVLALLDRHAVDLDRRITELVSTRDDVQRLRDRAAQLDPADCDEDGICHVIPTTADGWHTPSRRSGSCP